MFAAGFAKERSQAQLGNEAVLRAATISLLYGLDSLTLSVVAPGVGSR